MTRSVLGVSLLAMTFTTAGSAAAQVTELDQAGIDARIAEALRAGDEAVGHGGHGHHVKNVIVLIPDGCSQSIQTLARWYKGEPLAVDELNVGVVETPMADSVITDSASAATAFASGYKTSNGFLSVGPRADTVLSTYEWPMPPAYLSYRPLGTVLEGAKLRGKATGLISTSRFTHATPAGWACHSRSRNNEHKEIAEHMVYNEVDLVFGGGERNLLPISMGGKRVDGEDLVAVLQGRGYTIVRTEAEMNSSYGLPVYGMFNMSHMAPELDRPLLAPTEPSLADMTSRAIELLSSDPQGFFLMVEGSEVDWAGHANDAVWMVTDFIEFDEAVKVAVDFAAQDGRTLVLAYPDHSTGGLDIGNRQYNGAYTHLTVEALVDPLQGMTVTAATLAAEIAAMPGGVTVANIQTKAFERWNLIVSTEVAQEVIDLTGAQEGLDGYVVSFDYALGRVLSERYTAVGWTSHGHNAEDVPLWAFGPGAPAGLVDNTELATIAAEALGIDLDMVNYRLFVDLDDEFSAWTLDVTDPENPVAKLSSPTANAELPCNKDVLTVTTTSGTSRTYDLPGVVVHAPDTGRVYVSRLAVWIMHLYGIW